MNKESKKVVLSLDTSRYDKLVVGLEVDSVRKVIEEEFDYRKSQGVLPLLKRIIEENNLRLSDLTAVEVNTGPGSFTGLRVGVSIANTLGSILQIPINNQPLGLLVEPIYT
jgi:tRNA threonylcarbamoyladenosine biosynthesis protein TsaB